jgi:hypothetical protein
MTGTDPRQPSPSPWAAPDGTPAFGGGAAGTTQGGQAPQQAPHPTAPYPTAPYPTAAYPPLPGTSPGTPPPYYPQPPGRSTGPGAGALAGLVIGGLVLILMVGTGVVYLSRHVTVRDVPSASSEPLTTAGPDGGSEPTAPASEEPWAMRINMYCQSVDLELKAVAEAEPSRDQTSRLTKMAGVIRAMNTRLRTMEVPTAKRSQYESMMTAWEQVPIYYDLAVKAAVSKDSSAFRSALGKADTQNEKGNSIANGLGLTDCAGAGGLPENGKRRQPAGSEEDV